MRIDLNYKYDRDAVIRVDAFTRDGVPWYTLDLTVGETTHSIFLSDEQLTTIAREAMTALPHPVFASDVDEPQCDLSTHCELYKDALSRVLDPMNVRCPVCKHGLVELLTPMRRTELRYGIGV
jgi:hypothetical protein